MPSIRIVSDLHFEDIPYPNRFSLPGEFDVLVVAGDVWRSRPEDAVETVARLARGKPSVMVMGNHEPWGGTVGETLDRMRSACVANGVALLDDCVAEVEGVRFVGGTLWTDGRLGGLIEDYPDGFTGEAILNGEGKRWSLKDAAAAHGKTRACIGEAMAQKDASPLVVVTHHAPLRECLGRSDDGWASAGLLASDLSHLVDDGGAVLWVHGHLHRSLDLTRPGGTRVICNPAGNRFSNSGFDDGMTVSV